MNSALKRFHQSVRLGKSVARIDSRTLQLGKYIKLGLLPSPPKSANWTQKLSNLGPMGNLDLGDCTCAGAGHLIQTWTANSGVQFIPPDSAILAAYEAVGGYVPGDPSTDNGANEIDLLNYWRQTGIAGHKILAYASVNVSNEREIQQSIALFGGVYIGVAMPSAWQDSKNWDVNKSWISKLFGGGDWTPNSWGGHAIPLVGYDTTNGKSVYRVITWGDDSYTITGAALAKYCDEIYAPLSQDWLNAQGISPVGLDLNQLQSDLAQIT